jgi:hypothetical protein
MKTCKLKTIILLFLIALSTGIIAETTNVIDYAIYLNLAFGNDGGKVYDKIVGYKAIVKGDIEKALNEVWNRFTKYGPSKLPTCVVEAFETLRGQKIDMIYFAEGLRDYPHTEYLPGKDIIQIYNTYKVTSCELQSLIFHEMLHKAFDEMSEREKDKDQKDRRFCVRIITEYIKKCPDKSEVTDYECTNTFNFGSDEAIVEDCELNLFPCSLDFYKKSYDSNGEGYTEDGAREYNRPGNDCTEDKLCKKTGQDCLDDCPEDEKCPEKTPDHMDDNYSFGKGTINDFQLAPEALIYKGGFYQEALNLFGGLLWDGENSARELLRAAKVLIIPSGGLYSRENDSALKYILEEYVRLGGSLIILAQQYGSNYNLVPKETDAPLDAYGWREAQSCNWGSLYFDKETIHPVHSALTGERTSGAVDGYLSALWYSL